jgi:hypothetical protein
MAGANAEQDFFFARWLIPDKIKKLASVLQRQDYLFQKTNWCMKSGSLVTMGRITEVEIYPRVLVLALGNAQG